MKALSKESVFYPDAIIWIYSQNWVCLTPLIIFVAAMTPWWYLMNIIGNILDKAAFYFSVEMPLQAYEQMAELEAQGYVFDGIFKRPRKR